MPFQQLKENLPEGGLYRRPLRADRSVARAEVASAIAWLASDEAKMISGVELAVDGGLSAAGILHGDWDAANFRESYVASAAMYRPQTGEQEKAA